MGKSHHQHPDQEPEAADKKALRRVEDARASYTKADERVAALRARLARAEEKLVRRTTRLANAEDALAARANERADVIREQRIADTVGAAPARTDDARTDDARAAMPAPDTAPIAVQAIDDLAPVAVAAKDGSNGATPRRARARRASSTTDEA